MIRDLYARKKEERVLHDVEAVIVLLHGHRHARMYTLRIGLILLLLHLPRVLVIVEKQHYK